MRFQLGVILIALLSGAPLFAQAQPSAKSDQAIIVASAQKAAVRALNFRQGDLTSLTRARADFTSEGWKDYMKHMAGFLDAKGAPAFSSSFVPFKDPLVIGQENGSIRFRIPGTLKQSSRLGTSSHESTTTYRAAIEVLAGGNPTKILQLEQTTCAGASTACQ